jgi:hypothetical protein
LKPLLHPITENSTLQDLHFRFREQSPSVASKYVVSSTETKEYESILSNEEPLKKKRCPFGRAMNKAFKPEE